MASPNRYDTFFHRGDTFEFSFIYKSDGQVVDLTGQAVQMAISWQATKDGPIVVYADKVILTGTISAHEGVNGMVSFVMSDEATLAMPRISRAEYQIHINYSDGTVKTPLSGSITIYPNRFEAGA